MHSGDHSRADLALCGKLAFWTGGDRQRIERLFSQSGLGRREKWKRDDYRDRTITKALSDQTEFYDPDKRPAKAKVDGDELLEAITGDWFNVDEKVVRVHTAAGYTQSELVSLFENPDDLTKEQLQAVVTADGGEVFVKDDGRGWRVEAVNTEPWSKVRQTFANDHGDAPAITKATQLLLEKYDIATNSQTGNLYVYQNGAYHPNTDNSRVGGEALIRQYLNDAHTGVLEAEGTRRRAENIIKKTKDTTPVAVDELGGPDGKVCLQNGVLDISEPQEAELEDHSPDHLFTSQLNAEYDPSATCPRFKQFIGETVRPEDIAKLQEYCGYLLMHWDQRFKKALMLLGPNDSGKSTLSDTLAYILGEENVSGESMHDLAGNRFSPANLVDRLANINAELDSDGISSIGTFKKLTGNERVVRAERKNKDSFQFRVTAKMVFAANRVPDVKDADDAFYERMLLVSMPNTFSRKERAEAGDLRGKLQSEASGILNWMVEGYSRLVEQGRFTEERDLDGKRDFWEAYGDPVERFKQECLTVTGDHNDMELQSDLYDQFKSYCQAKGLAFDGKKNLFTRKLTVAKIGKSRRTGDDWSGQKYVYVGAELNKDAYREAVGKQVPAMADGGNDDDDTRNTGLGEYDGADDGGDSETSDSTPGDTDRDPKGASTENATAERQSEDIDGSGGENDHDSPANSWGQLLAEISTYYSSGDEIDPEEFIDRVDRDINSLYAQKGLETLADGDVIERKDGVFIA